MIFYRVKQNNKVYDILTQAKFNEKIRNFAPTSFDDTNNFHAF